MKTVIIRLAGVKEKSPSFVIRNADKTTRPFGSSVPMKVTGVYFRPEEFDGNVSYKLKCRGIITTESGKEVPVLVDFGGSSLAKGFANSLLSATSDLSDIRFSVYKSKNSDSFGGAVSDLTIENNGKKGKENSQNLPWAISGDERSAMVKEVVLKGKTTYDDTEFCEQLTALIADKFGTTHPFTSEYSNKVDDSLFQDSEGGADELADDFDIDDIPTAETVSASKSKKDKENIDIDDIPF